MGKIFISAGHGGREKGGYDRGAIAGDTTEAKEMILLRDEVVSELRKRKIEFLSVPDALSMSSTIQWINAQGRRGDVALEIYTNASNNPSLQGAAVFYIANNTERKKQAELLLNGLLSRVPQLYNRGVKSDTATGVGASRQPFCRDVILPSLVMEVGFLTNQVDLFLLQNLRDNFALGIADGLEAWSDSPKPPPVQNYPQIEIKLNNQLQKAKGILVNNNAYIPDRLATQLGLDLIKAPQLRRLQYQGVVYVKAVELQDFNIGVSWNNNSRTVILLQLDKIMGKSLTRDTHLSEFLRVNNQKALRDFGDLPKLYVEEASIEGVNHDIAFCQMCVETGFLSFSSGDIKSIHNNFGGLGGIGGESATFLSARLGVRAHIQHLKAYANLEPLVQDQVDPRFNFVYRGVAPLVGQMSQYWSENPEYGNDILKQVRSLYKLATLL